MINKNIMALAIFLVCLLAVGVVSAADNSTDDVVGVEVMTEDTFAVEDQEDVLDENDQSFSNLNEKINGNNDENVYLDYDYAYTEGDDDFKEGIVIDRDVIVYGNGHTIDANNEARIFNVCENRNVVFYNITFVNGHVGVSKYGGAILGTNCYAINCTFNNNYAGYGGAMGCEDQTAFSVAINCTFNDNYANMGGAMYFGVAIGCNFTNNSAFYAGNAMFYSDYANCNGQPSSDFKADNLILAFYVDDLIIGNSSSKLFVNLVNNYYKDDLIRFIGVEVSIIKDNRRLKTYSCVSGDVLSLDLEPGIYTAEFNVKDSGLYATPVSITINVLPSFSNLNDLINGNSNLTEIYLNSDYAFNSSYDSGFEGGIVIDRDVTVYGNGHTINGCDKARIFKVNDGYNVVFKDIIFANGRADYNEDGGAINGEGKAINCTFKDNYADNSGGAIYWGHAVNCTFENNRARDNGGAIQSGTAVNCTFINNSATRYGGALSWSSVIDCTFKDNFADENEGNAMLGCNYVMCTSQSEGYDYCHSLTLEFGINDINMYDNEQLLVDLRGTNNKPVPLVDTEVTIFKDIEQVETYSCLSWDRLVLDLPPGIYTANFKITYPGLNPVSKNITLTFNSATANIEVSAADVTYPNDVVVNVKCGVSGEYTVKVGDKSQIINLDPNVAQNVIFTGLAANEEGYVVNVTPNSQKIEGCNDSVRAVVHKVVPTIGVSAADVTYPNDVIVNVVGDVDGEYTVKCGNAEQKINLTANEVKQVAFSQLNPKEYLINVTYDETENYTMAINNTVKVNVAKAGSSVAINDIADAFFNQELIISFNVENRTTVREVITKDGMEVSNQTVGGDYFITKLGVGTYTITIYNDESETIAHSSDTKSFNVNKLNPTITPTVDFNDNLTAITVNVDSNATGYVTIGVLGLTFIDHIDDGKAVFTYDFEPGTYNATVSYLGDENYNNATTSVSFTVTEHAAELKNTDISVDVDAVENEVTITANVNPRASGLVEFNILGKAVYVAVNNGKAVYTTNLPAGDYNVSVTYTGDSRFNANRTSKSFTVTDHIKKNTTLNSEVTVEGYEVNMTVTVDSDATGFVEFASDGDAIYVKVIDGKAAVNTIMFPGDYTITASYLGDDDFNANTTEIKFTVEDIPLKDTNISADIEIIDNNVTITVTVDENATGFVEFEVSGAENYALFIEVKGGVAILEDVLSSGDYKVEITYLGDFNFNMNATSETFTIAGHVKKDTAISSVAAVDNYTVTITTTVDSNATGYVTIAILGQTFIVPVDDGKAVFTYDFNPGTYAADVAYLGDNNFNNATTTVSFTVTKQVVELKNTTLDVIVSSYENDVSIVAVVDSSASGLVEFVVGDNAVYLAVNNGEAGYEIVLPGGEYNVTVTYLGDGKFNSNSTTKEFVVYNHIKGNTTVNSDVVVDSITVSITANVDSRATGFVEFNIAGKKYYAPVVDGKAVLVNDFVPGTYMGNIKYLGDDNFNEASSLVYFNVLEQNVTLANTTLDVIVSSHENDVSIVAVVDSSATGYIEFAVGDSAVYVAVNNGEAGYEIVLPGGDYNVTVTYLGDVKFNSNSTTKEFVVYDHIKGNTTINSDVVVDANTVSITVNVDSRATGFVEFVIAGKKYYAPVVDGKAVLVSDFLVGIYSGNVNYLGDDNFNPASTLVYFQVIEKNVTLDDTPIDVVVGAMENDVTIIATVNESATGLVEFIIGDSAVYVAVTNGEAVYNVVLAGGDYNVTVTYMGDSRFNPNSTKKAFTVSDHVKANTTMTADVVVDGYEVNMTVTVDSAATGFVEFDLDGDIVYAKVNEGKAVVNTILFPGDYTIKATYLGDDDFNANTTDIKFTVEGTPVKDTNIDADVEIVDNNVTITVTVDENATGFVEFMVNGAENFTIIMTVQDGKVTYEDVLKAGDYEVIITYFGDAYFNMNSTTEKFTIVGHIKNDTSISAVPTIDDTTITLDVKVDSAATGYVTIAVLGQTFIVPVNDGKAVFEYDFFPGSYVANVAYLGDDNFNNATTTASFTVIKKDAVLKNTTLDVAVSTDGNEATIAAKVNPSASGFIEFNIDGNPVYIAVNNGNAVYTAILPAGTYDVAVTYLGDYKFNANSTSVAFNVSEPETNITVVVDGKEYSATVVNGTAVVTTDPVDTNITVVVDGKEYSATVVNGTAVVTTDPVDANITVIVDGKEYPAELINGTATITIEPVKQIATVIEAEYKFTRQANDYAAGERGDYFYAVLKDINGNPLANMPCKVAVNGPIYDVVTDSKGRFGVQVNLAAANTYTYALSFLGNEKYSASFNSTKLILAAKKTSITAANKAFKAKTKTKTISVTLKTVKNPYNGKTYLSKGKKLTLKINGKTYTAKTNAKGVAKFTIKLTKKGKYAAAIKFAGDKTYKASSKKILVTIK